MPIMSSLKKRGKKGRAGHKLKLKLDDYPYYL